MFLALVTLATAVSVQSAPQPTPLPPPPTQVAPPGAVAVSPTPHLSYYGGPILSNVRVYAVSWGPNVNAATQQRIGGFYDAFTSSMMFDWLSEYSTTNVTPVGGGSGSHQSLGHGTFGGNFTITPSTASTTIDDAQIQTELRSQIVAGHLPAPDANALYVVQFPPGVGITFAGNTLCQQLCSYHAAAAPLSAGSIPIRYAVLPDVNPPSACSVGCGAAQTAFDNLTSLASREVVGAVTDPDVTLAQGYGAPLSWYDPQDSHGEIGDICNGVQGTFTAGGGTTYTVQKEWSNLSNACLGVERGDAFSISIAPFSRLLAAGTSTSYQVVTTVLRGAPQTINLTTAGLPTGITGAINPSALSAGASATVTLTASSAAAPGTSTFSVAGTGSVAANSGSAQVTVTGGGGRCPPGTVAVGGVCVPSACSVTTSATSSRSSGGLAWLAALPLGLAIVRRLRRRAP